MADRTLIQIADDVRALEDLLIEAEGDVSTEDAEAAIDKWLKENLEAEASKLDGYAFLIREIEGYAKQAGEMADEFDAKKTAAMNRAKRLKDRIKWYLEEVKGAEPDGKYKVAGNAFTFALQNNGGATPVILEADAELHPEELPEQYRRVIYQPHLDNVRRDLERLAELDATLRSDLGDGVMDYIDEMGELDYKYMSLTKGWDAETKDRIIEARDLHDALEGVGRLGDRGKHVRIR